jgi:hypothetical protein
VIPTHWAVLGPGKARPLDRLLRNVRGGHAATLRRLLRIGPFGFYVIRYKPGHVEELAPREKLP